MTTGGSYTFLHSFNPGTDGTESHAVLAQTLNGDFYGTTRLAGPHADGTIFQVTPTGTFTTLYTFCAQSGCPDGSNPFAGLIATRGNFYGTTSSGGSAGNPRYGLQLVGAEIGAGAVGSHDSLPPGRHPYRRRQPDSGGNLRDLQRSATRAERCSDFVFGSGVFAECHAGADRSAGFLSHHLACRSDPAAVSTMNSLDGA